MELVQELELDVSISCSLFCVERNYWKKSTENIVDVLIQAYIKDLSYELFGLIEMVDLNTWTSKKTVEIKKDNWTDWSNIYSML